MKKVISLFVIFTILMNTSACIREETDTIESSQQISEQTVLTHVYTETEYSLPDGYNYGGIASKTTNSVTIQCTKPSTDESMSRLDITLYTDGREPLMIESETKYTLLCSAGNVSYGLWNSFDSTTNKAYYHLDKISQDGTITTVNDIASLIEGPAVKYFYPQDMVTDSQGNIYISALEHILVLSHNLELLSIVDGIEHFQSLQTGKDGMVYVCYRDTYTGDYVLCPVTPGNNQLGIPISLPAKSNPEGIYFGEGYDVYYLNKEGFYGYNISEESSEKLMDLKNSGLSDGIVEAAVLSTEYIFINYINVSGNHYSIMQKADDIDLTTNKIIEIVTLDENDDLVEAVMAYNRKNNGYHVSVIDYSDRGGEEALLRDISANLVSPDLYCLPQSDTMRYLFKNNMIIDLYPFLNSEEIYTNDNLIGAVKNTYTISEKLLALPMYITVETVIGDKNVVGETWNAEQMLNIARTQKQDEYLSYNLYREEALTLLFGDNFEEIFIDWQNYTFDKTLFNEVIRYINNLPLKKDRPKIDQISKKYEGYETGKYLTSIYTYTSVASILGDQIYFSPEHISRIGYPASNNSNGSIITDQTDAFMISKNCEFPEEVWKFIELNIECAKPTEMSAYYYIPVWKSLFWEAVETTYEMEYFCNHTGGITAMPIGVIELEPDGSLHGNTGIKTVMTQETAENFLAWIDTIGIPFVQFGDTKEIKEIILEETSALWADTCTIEQCVDRVYSRIQLWLSEHE